MSDNQQVLTKAIQKVAKTNPELIPIDVSKIDRVEYFDGVVTYWAGHRHWTFNIFNHDFAKALWGEDERKPEKFDNSEFMTTVFKRDWQYHLQQMVIADDPIKYLGEHIDG